jgi:hypothetical protein
LRWPIAEVEILASLLVTALLGPAYATEGRTTSTCSRTTGPADVLEPVPPMALPGASAEPIGVDAATIATV